MRPGRNNRKSGQQNRQRESQGDTHKEIQTAIFGENEVLALGKDLREFINKRSIGADTEENMSFDNFLGILAAIEKDSEQKRAVVEVQFKGPAVNAGAIADILKNRPEVFFLNAEGLEKVEELLRVLPEDSPDTFRVVAEIDRKMGLDLNRQEFLALIAYWATNADAREKYYRVFQASGSGKPQTGVGAFTEQEMQEYLAKARQYFTEGQHEHALQYFSYAIGVAERIGAEDIADLRQEASEAFSRFIKAKAGVDELDIKQKVLIYGRGVDLLVSLGGLDLADLLADELADELAEQFPREVGQFKNKIKNITSSLLTDEKFHVDAMKKHQITDDYPASIYHAKICILLDPTFGGYYSNLGAMLSGSEREEEALRVYEKALEIDPNNNALYNSIGRSYTARGLYDNAIDVFTKSAEGFEQTLKEDPSLRSDITFMGYLCASFLSLADAYFEQGSLERAKEVYDKASLYAGEISATPEFASVTTALTERIAVASEKINARLFRASRQARDETAVEDMHFVYGFNSTPSDAELQILDIQAILLRAEQEGRKVSVIFPEHVLSLSTIKRLFPDLAGDPEAMFARISDKLFVDRVSNKIAEDQERWLQNILKGDPDGSLRKKRFGSANYKRALIDLIVNEKLEAHPVSSTRAEVLSGLLKAQYYNERVEEAFATGVKNINFDQILEWKRSGVEGYVKHGRRENELAFEKAMQLKHEDPESVVIVIMPLNHMGVERKMEREGYSTANYYPSIFELEHFAIPEHRIINKRIVQEKEDETFTPEEEALLKKSIMGHALFNICNSDSALMRHQIAKRILDRVSGDDMALFLNDLEEDKASEEEEAGFPLVYSIAKWLLLHAKITDNEREKYFTGLVAVEDISHIRSSDIKHLLEQLSNPDTVVARQSALVLGRIAGTTGIDDLRDAIFHTLLHRVLLDAGVDIEKTEITESGLIEMYLARPKTQIQFMAALSLQEMGALKGVQLDEGVLKDDLKSLAVALGSGDEVAKGNARKRFYAEGHIVDLSEAYLQAKSQKDKSIFMTAMKELSDKQLVNAFIKELFSDDENSIVAAEKVLGEIGNDRAVLPLIYQLRHEKKRISVEAKKAIVRIGREALPVLEHVVNDPERYPNLAGLKKQLKALAEKIARSLPKETVQKTIAGSDKSSESQALLTREEIIYRAELFKAELTRILTENPERVYVVAIDTDIGDEQKAQIMPLYTALDRIMNAKGSEGKPLFPNLRAVRASGDELIAKIENETTDFGDVLLVAKRENVENHKFDKLLGRAWISAIDDTKVNRFNYLPVFEAVTINMMAALNVDLESIKRFCDTISATPVSIEELRHMVEKKLIYILPKLSPMEPEKLQELYELTKTIYLSV